MEKKLYYIINSGENDAITSVELTQDEFNLFNDVFTKLNANKPLYSPVIQITENADNYLH